MRAVRTGRVITIFGGTAPKLQVFHSVRGARLPSLQSSSKSKGSQPSAQPLVFRPVHQTYHTLISMIHPNDLSHCVHLTFNVALQIVVFHKGHISKTLPTGVSNQASGVKDILKPAKLYGCTIIQQQWVIIHIFLYTILLELFLTLMHPYCHSNAHYGCQHNVWWQLLQSHPYTPYIDCLDFLANNLSKTPQHTLKTESNIKQDLLRFFTFSTFLVCNVAI